MDKSGKSTGWKVFALGATAALIALTAFAGSAAAQQYAEEPDWVNTFIYDQGDPNPPSELTTHTIGQDLPIIVQGYDDPIELRVINRFGNQIGTPKTCNPEEVCYYPIPQVSPGEYRIQLNTHYPDEPVSDWVDVDTFQLQDTVIPEFPTVAVPLVVAILLACGFMRKKKGL